MRRFPTVERRAALHQEGSTCSLTPIPSDEELRDAVLKELGLRKKLGAAKDEVCGTILITIMRNFHLQQLAASPAAHEVFFTVQSQQAL
ncbi:hypothetical protein OS493_040676 [Desmophyllum pertusum]|uniref:Uncharacterized protein n=1 Tax=Desmophyllum pertusum TaxID=174260 RepID=A0A9W9Z5Z2_9CNID|nr:hypothetical protein OS493_040676 [Desmophyllum pertusum]